MRAGIVKITYDICTTVDLLLISTSFPSVNILIWLEPERVSSLSRVTGASQPGYFVYLFNLFPDFSLISLNYIVAQDGN